MHANKYFYYIRFLLLVCLTVLIGLKTISIITGVSSSVKKEVLATENDTDSEKKTEKTDTEKEQEFALFNDYNAHINGVTGDVIHKTIYSNRYQSAHFANISIPPPDTFTFLHLA